MHIHTLKDSVSHRVRQTAAIAAVIAFGLIIFMCGAIAVNASAMVHLPRQVHLLD
jgi:hypothetical protein